MPKKKTAAQLDREIAQALTNTGTTTPHSAKTTPHSAKTTPHSAKTTPHSAKTTPHSAKALATLAIMGTTPSQWQLTPIEVVEEEREVPGLVPCPTCRGRKFVRIEDGHVIPPPARSEGDAMNFDYDRAARRDALKAHKNYGNCPRCAKRQGGWGMIPQGKIMGRVRAMVKVGYPKFPPGTRFDSRFHGGLHCNLCNKLLMRARRVPVHATGDDGITHGMFVGEDCGRKFLDVKLPRNEIAVMENGNARVSS